MRKCNDLHPGHDFQIFPVFTGYHSFNKLEKVYLICKNCGYTIEKVGIDWNIPIDTEQRDNQAREILKSEMDKLKKKVK